MSLIKNADTYVELNMNILLAGMHGVGKTWALRELAERHGLKVKYFSCSTLDPYVDIVGIPVEKKDASGNSYLELVRQPSLDEAELIFFDELNRVEDAKVLNAVFEIIQFHTINGEPLPNLRMCWAAINANVDGSKEDYQVHDLDPALIDRFDAYQVLKPMPSVKWMSKFMDEKVAAALVTWWKDQNNRKDYVSPRRLHKIGEAVSKTKNPRLATFMLPPDGTYDTGKLQNMLAEALGLEVPKDPLANKPMPKNGQGAWTFPDGTVLEKKYMFFDKKKNPVTQSIINSMTIQQQAAFLTEVCKGTGAKTIGLGMESFKGFHKTALDAMFKSFNPTKRSQVRQTILYKKTPLIYKSEFKDLLDVIT